METVDGIHLAGASRVSGDLDMFHHDILGQIFDA